MRAPCAYGEEARLGEAGFPLEVLYTLNRTARRFESTNRHVRLALIRQAPESNRLPAGPR